MKNVFIFLLIVPLFISCNNDDDTESTPPEEAEVSLLGTWQLIAGRNSSDTAPFPPEETPFVDIESEKTVTFSSNNVIESNGNALCVNSFLMGDPTSGIYNMLDATYTSNDCVDPDYIFPYTQTDSIVVISYFYNGISEAKFKKIADLE